MNRIFLAALFLMSLNGFADTPKSDAKSDAKLTAPKGKTMIAVFETSMGTFKAKLANELAPKTVENFVGLAKGTKEWEDPKTHKKVKTPDVRQHQIPPHHQKLYDSRR